MTEVDYNEWLKLRNASKDELGDKLCYCGHTDKCSCADPGFRLFKESVERGTIKLGDPNNGWQEWKNFPDKPVKHLSSEINRRVLENIIKEIDEENK